MKPVQITAPITKDIADWVITICTLNCNTGIDAATTETAHDDLI